MIMTDSAKATALKTTWRCPSNIAIVKYWGKYGNQLPCNSSLSLTLSNSYTEIELSLTEKKNADASEVSYFFEGKKNEAFEKRVVNFVQNNRESFSFLADYAIEIQSHNSFPHSAGIASSASAFGAIALSLLGAAYTLENKQMDTEFYKKVSYLARLGSGSASRSMYAGFALWGENKLIEGSSNDFAIPVNAVHANFQAMCDAILIVEDEPKKVSSSVGHGLMNNHAYAANRFEQANERTVRLLEVLKNGDYAEFIQLAESEALTLHAMMMASSEYYLLLKPGTITAIEKIMNFRKETNIPVCFTLDAGPNVHVLYPQSHKTEVESFLQHEVKDSYKKIIFDQVGKGPELIAH